MNDDGLTVYTLNVRAGYQSANIPFTVYGGVPGTSFEISLDSYYGSDNYKTHYIGDGKNYGMKVWETTSDFIFDENGRYIETRNDGNGVGISGTACNAPAHRGSWVKFKLYHPATDKTIYFTINWI